MKRRESKLQRLMGILAARDPRAATALVTILEIMSEIDRRRATMLLEAIGVLVMYATRPKRTVRP